MALTPEDVQNKLFTTVRLREGYDQTEVDEFLDEVESELRRLLQEIDGLRAAGAAADDTGAASAQRPAAPAATEPRVVHQAAQEIVVRTSGDVSAAAAKVLEMAQRTADQYVGEARAEADSLLENARTAAEELSAEARASADAIDRETHERTTELQRRLDEQRQATLDALQDEKRRLESEVETLRSFEREYRGRLRTFLTAQLEELSPTVGGDTPLAPAGGPDTSHAAPRGADPDSGDVDTGGDDERGGSADDGPTEESAQGGRRGRGSLPVVHRDGDNPEDTAPRSALGRILEEEERNLDGRA